MQLGSAQDQGSNTSKMMYQSMQAHQQNKPDATNLSQMNQTLTPHAPTDNLTMGLGGEDILTDGASQVRIEQDIKEM